MSGQREVGVGVTEPGLTPEQRQERVAGLRGQAEGVLSELREKLAAVRETQSQALAVMGEATSRDGSVRVMVDATGVVTSLTFAPSAFERGSPEKLAQATVATIQAAAAQARAKVGEVLGPLRAQSGPVLAAAMEGVPGLGAASLVVPEVPRTAVDPAVSVGSWRQADPEPVSRLDNSAAPRPDGSSRPGSASRDDDGGEDSGGSVFTAGSW
jgi:DNA-binding protein YbaB